MTAKPAVGELIAGLAERLGVPAFVSVCTDLMGGAERETYVEELRCLTGHNWQPGDTVFDRDSWQDYWVRTWGARGLLHVWHDSAAPAVVAGLADEHWRPAEMCLKVVARHDVAGAGDGAAALLSHELPRVRAQALRALGVVGDTEHVELVRARLEDREEWVRRQAARAVEQLGTRLDGDRDPWLAGS
ncbi:HEAT repeat domain-containing protein [Nocardioides dilutus]